eukprot:2409358-Pleurochrysis_carterae.AAC.1
MYGEATTDAAAVGMSGVAAAAQSATSLRSAQCFTPALPPQWVCMVPLLIHSRRPAYACAHRSCALATQSHRDRALKR